MISRPGRVILALCLLAVGALSEAAAQSSMFGVRGLGYAGRPWTARARGTEGSFVLFDGESDANPAAIGRLPALTVGFVASPGWRWWDTPAGDAKLQETRFPLMYAGGPIPGARLAVAISAGSYFDRDYRLASIDTVIYRGTPLEVKDTVESLGGLNQLRLAFAYGPTERTSVGLAAYWITGSSRMKAKRVFSDTTYVVIRQSAELAYGGFGLSAGVIHRVSPRLELAGTVRMDSKASVDRDSSFAYDIDLPWSVHANVLWRASPRLAVGVTGAFHTWAASDADIQAQGGVGTQDSWEAAAGVELATSPRSPAVMPVRVGFRFAQLPFLLHPGESPREVGISLGTGTRFARDRAGVDFALDYSSRKEAPGFQEKTLQLILGLSISPYGSGVR